MKKLKIGIIGTGNISNEHIKAYQNNPNAELYAFCDINQAQLEKMAGLYGVTRTYTDAAEMLKLEELDAVSVCTWNSAHADCAIAALNAGKHVLCEKPMALNAGQAARMKEAAEKSGKLLMIGFVRRYGNDCAVLEDFIDSGAFGEFYYAKASYLRRNGNPGGWFGDKSRSGGGPLIDLGVHFIDLVRYLMGKPKAVSVYGVTYQKLFNRPGVKSKQDYVSVSKSDQDVCDVEDLASALVRFDNGAALAIETAFCLNLEKDRGDVELFGTKAGAKLTPELHIYTENNGYLTNVTLDYPTSPDFGNLFQNEIDHYVSCLLNQTACKSPAEDGVELMRILDAIYESAKTGHEVLL